MSIGRVPGATGIQPSIVDAKGDLIVATAADSVSRLAVGSNDQVLTADSTQATGVKWATPATGMTNPLTTTGDTIYSSSGSTPARLAIGSTGQVLTVSGGIPSWSTPSSGGMTLLESGSLSGASVTTGTLSGSYNHLELMLYAIVPVSNNVEVRIRFNGDTGTNYNTGVPTPSGVRSFDRTTIKLSTDANPSGGLGVVRALIPLYSTSGFWKIVTNDYMSNQSSTSFWAGRDISVWNNTGAITSITILPESGNWTSGTYRVYGVK